MAGEMQIEIADLVRTAEGLAPFTGAVPVRLKVFSDSVQVVDPSTADGCFEILIDALRGDGLDRFVKGHALLGTGRKYRIQFFLPEAKGELVSQYYGHQ